VRSLLRSKGFVEDSVLLQELHLYVEKELQSIDANGFNSLTYAFYETDSGFQSTYFQLIKFLVQSVLHFDCFFQTVPNVRFHFPQPFHNSFRDENGHLLAHHSDTMLGHPFEEINCWLPLTDCYGSNTLQLAPLRDSVAFLEALCKDFNFDSQVYHRYGRQLFYDRLLRDLDYRQSVLNSCSPVVLSPGELILFDSRCIHATAENEESFTRISLDFRLIPVSVYASIDRVYRSAGKSGRAFVRGDVFYQESANELNI
jgi:ectoine hydroxylase-related dioxygenase (phytanoyl-CoA dioxygenase family)